MAPHRTSTSRRPSTAAPAKVVTLVPEGAESSELVRITYVTQSCVIGHLRNMTFCAWNAAPIARDVEAFIALAEQLTQTYPLNSNVSLVMRNADLPGADARAALERLTTDYASAIHGVALVIDGSGFRASIIRSFLTGLHLLRGNGYRCKTFGKPTEANRWLLDTHNAETGVVLTEREMQAACDAIFARMARASMPAALGR